MDHVVVVGLTWQIQMGEVGLCGTLAFSSLAVARTPNARDVPSPSCSSLWPILWHEVHEVPSWCTLYVVQSWKSRPMKLTRVDLLSNPSVMAPVGVAATPGKRFLAEPVGMRTSALAVHFLSRHQGALAALEGRHGHPGCEITFGGVLAQGVGRPVDDGPGGQRDIIRTRLVPCVGSPDIVRPIFHRSCRRNGSGCDTSSC